MIGLTFLWDNKSIDLEVIFMATVISTHKLFNALKESGFPETQANAVINTIETMQDARFEEVVTKADLYKVEAEIKSDLKLLHWGVALILAVIALPYLKTMF
ncbi:hypothetical protein THMIRHAT_05620 [Thiosulfativibrio zosterae]|uniref:DUF1640 domain-containing protein n=1 Tax=Thiosulfativibrio zosterae TaxID=2675053 RepID=A0A6F8PL54_9GAMM|nr:hypothetical protein THMIRHAT_05620 [Thiosulfativibrio zosterae]